MLLIPQVTEDLHVIHLNRNVVLSHPVLCHICKSMCLFKTQVKYSSAFLGYLWNFFLNVVCKLEYENFNIRWRILVWLILVVCGMIYKWPRKGQHSFTWFTYLSSSKAFLCIFYFIENSSLFWIPKHLFFFNHWRDRHLTWKAVFLPEQRISGLKRVPENSSCSWKSCLKKNYS